MCAVYFFKFCIGFIIQCNSLENKSYSHHCRDIRRMASDGEAWKSLQTDREIEILQNKTPMQYVVMQSRKCQTSAVGSEKLGTEIIRVLPSLLKWTSSKRQK